MALINSEITPRSYEIIRDQLAAIVTSELVQQAAITYDDLFLAPVYLQRAKNISVEECPLVNIAVDSGKYDNQTVIDSDGEFTFFIDVFTTSSYTTAKRGDELSSKEAQRLAGVIQGILSNPQYVTLGFARPFIMRSKVVGFEPGTITKDESTNLAVVRITLSVKAIQNELVQQPISEFEISTQVFLYETEQGYLYSGVGAPLPPPSPTCEPVTVYDTDGNLLGTKESGGAFIVDDSTVILINSLGDEISQTDVLATETKQITAPNANYRVLDQNTTVLATGSIPSNDNQDVIITITNKTYSITDTDGNILYSGTVTVDLVKAIQDATVTNSNGSFTASILAEGNGVLPDITVNVLNSLDDIVDTQIVPSVQDVNANAPDAHINIKKTGDGTIASVDIPSGTSTNYSVADNAITVNGANDFTIDATDPLDIVLTDTTGASITPDSVTYHAGTHHVDIVLEASTTPHWTRNPDWLPLDTVTVGSQKFSGLFAVYETQKNVCTIRCETGTRTIDWGDGTTQLASSGVLYTKVYDYASITSPIITDEFGYNYKTVVVNIPMTGCTQLYIDRNTTATLINNTRSLNWLDVALDCSTLTVFFPSNHGISNKMERLVIYNVGATISGNTYFVQMARLKVLKFPFDKLQASNQTFTNYFGNVRNEDGTPININLSINTGSLFNLFSLSSITRIGNFTAPLSTSGQSIFESSSQLISIGSINLSSATNLVSMFLNCLNLENVVNITITSTCTSLTQLGVNARKCKGFVIGTCSGVTSATNAFANMVSMETLILTEMTSGFVIDDCNMSATAIDALFTSLGTASGSQTISVKRNPGSATCTTSIATSKGYTVLTA